jgi:hypothetical protein
MYEDDMRSVVTEDDEDGEELPPQPLLPFERLMMEEREMRHEIVMLRREVRRLERALSQRTNDYVAATERASRNMLTAALAGAFDEKTEKTEMTTTGFERTPGGAWLVTTEPTKVNR